MTAFDSLREQFQRFMEWCNEPVELPGGRSKEPELDEIIARLNAEVHSSPTDGMLRLRLGRALVRDGRIDNGIREIRAAAELFLQESEARKARSAYKLILDMRPSDARARDGYARAQDAVWAEEHSEEHTEDDLVMAAENESSVEVTPPLAASDGVIPVDASEMATEPAGEPVTADGPAAEAAVPQNLPELRPTMVATASQERRTSPRVPWVAEVEILTSRRSMRADACDLSAEGIRVEGMGDFQLREEVSLRIHLPDSEVVGTGRGIVTWRGRGMTPRSRLGIRLSTVDPETRAAMLQHLAEKLGYRR